MVHTLRSLLSVTRYIPKRASLVSAIILGVLAPAATFAWGPANRATYTMAHAATHPVFNSITDNPVQGDERNFMQVREAGQSNDKYVDSISLKPNTEYVAYVYYHNDANSALNGKDFTGKGVAHGAYVKVDLPDYVNDGQSKVNAEGYIGATNTTPKQVFDEVYFSNTSGQDLSLTYEKGSATIHNNGKTDGKTLPDSIVSGGAKIGYDALDGTVPGCHNYAGYVTLRFKTGSTTTSAVSSTPSFTIKKQVRMKGTTGWSSSLAAKPGDTVQYLATYTNTGSRVQNDIMLKDTLPAHLSYVSGSSVLTDGSNPTGKKVSDGITGSKGIDIGNYAGGAVGYLVFDAKVKNDVSCGTTTLTNGVSATSDNVSKGATASVRVTKSCTAATPPATTTTPSQPAQTIPATTVPETVTAPAETTTTTTSTTQPTTSPAATTTAPAAVQATTTTAAPSPAPAQTVTTLLPAATPSTGPGSFVGSAFGLGSLGLGIHYYLQSRRTIHASLQK